jgi:guanylate kinase
MLVIISGPSGVGKDTIIDALRQRPRDPDYFYVITCTTRAPRPGEIDGVSYHFLTRPEFLALRDSGGLLEANEVHGHWYGTPRSQVREALAAGHDVILKIDVQGAQQVKERVPNALLIFVVPPSLETLFQRLRARATETADELERRQRNAAIELARQEDYDYVVTNEDGQVERTAERIDEIIADEHRRHPDRTVHL